MLCEKGEAGAGDGHANVQGEAEGRACRATQGPRRGAQAEAQEEGAELGSSLPAGRSRGLALRGPSSRQAGRMATVSLRFPHLVCSAHPRLSSSKRRSA